MLRALRSLPTRRSYLTISPTVHNAISTNKPVVALESTIITHGLPYPANVDMARDVEEIVRSEGAVPATIAFIEGKGHVGIDNTQLDFLAKSENLVKVSRRDIPHVLAKKLSGGTTIASTMILAHMAGIKVFGTGGLGGVHRGVADTWDISADLEELGRTPVAVVCSGPKSILDIPKTLEFLETKGVPVYTQGAPGVDVPGFFTRYSGVESPFNFHTALDAAEAIRSAERFGLDMGSVWCVPCPDHLSMDPRAVNKAIDNAIIDAAQQKIVGKETTPFLLKKVWEQTKGDSVQVNIQFVKNNARMAAQIARELAADGSSVSIQVPQQVPVASTAASTSDAAATPQQPKKQFSKSKIAVVGALAQDVTCTLSTDNISVSSYPGQISTTIGGVAHNVALASTYTGTPTRLISVIGDKEESSIMNGLGPLDPSGILVSPTKRTARYVSTNDSKGDLIVACSDMESIDKMDINHIDAELKRADPDLIIFDGNLGQQQVSSILKNNSNALKVFEPTSIPKSAKLAHQDLKVFPNADITFSTPNSMELMSMFEEFSFRDKFDLDNWFPIIDALPMDQPATQFKLNAFINRSPEALSDIVQSGLIQAAVQLLPFIPNLFIKLGSHGVLTVQLIEYLKDRTGSSLEGVNSVYIVNRNAPCGVLIQHHPIPETISQEKVKSVNGIGDTFCGVLAAELVKNKDWLRDDGELKAAAIERAQRAAAMSLQTLRPVNKDIKKLFV